MYEMLPKPSSSVMFDACETPETVCQASIKKKGITYCDEWFRGQSESCDNPSEPNHRTPVWEQLTA